MKTHELSHAFQDVDEKKGDCCWARDRRELIIGAGGKGIPEFRPLHNGLRKPIWLATLPDLAKFPDAERFPMQAA